MEFEAGTTMLLVVLQNAVFVALTLGAFWGGVLALRGFGSRVSLSHAPLGFIRPPRGVGRALIVGIALGFVGVVVSAVLAAASRYGLRALGYPAEGSAQQPFMDGISSWVSQSPALAIPLVFLVIGLLTPVAEEILFRGGIFGGLHRLFSTVSERVVRRRTAGSTDDDQKAAPRHATNTAAFAVSAGLSSAVFASLHLEPVIFASIFTLAVGLCWLRSHGGLLAPIAAHATFNSFTVAVLVLSGLGVLPQAV